MPYYPDDQTEENLKKIRRNNVCAVCGRPVWIYINLTDKRQYIACPTPGHEGLAKEYQPSRFDEENTLRRLVEMEQTHGRATTTAVAKLPRTGQLTRQEAEHILGLVYPGVPRDEIIRCAILCRDFGLHPLMKEVYILGFKNAKTGKTDYSTVIGIGASRKMAANKKGAYSYLDDTPRTATQQEIIKQYGKDSEEERDNLISICKVKGEKGNEAIGFGLWPKDKIPYGMDKGNTRRNMANIRSERPALDRLPGESLPQGIEVIDEAYIELPDVSKVDTNTGEITESIIEEPSTESITSEPEPKEHWCQEHNCAFEKKTGKFGEFYAHKKPEGGWCNEKKKKKTEEIKEELAQPEAESELEKTIPNTVEYLKETMQICNWDSKQVGQYCNQEKGWDVHFLKDLNPEQLSEVIDHIKRNPK